MELGPNGKATFTWSMLGTVCDSALNCVLLLVVNRVVGETLGGIYTLAFSHAQLMYFVATLESRPIHSTDVKQKYRFADYFTLRIITCLLMMAVSLGYVLWMDADPLKKHVMLYMCAFKAVDALFDVFACMYQQHDRIEFSGKVSTVKICVEMIVFVSVLLLTRNLEYASLAMVAASLAVLFNYNLRKWRLFEDARIELRFDKVTEILLASLPLFVSVFVLNYISNAPKYAINTYCTDVVQNRYSILFMPAFAINVMCQFVMRPMLTPMARMWNNGRVGDFRKNILKLMALVGCVTVLAVGAAWLLGIPVLNLLYGVDLWEDRIVLVWVMVYGGLSAVNIFLYDMIAVTRRQQWLLGAYLIAATAVFFLAPALVRSAAMTGAIRASILSLALLDVLLVGIIAQVIRKAKPENAAAASGDGAKG